MKYAKPLPTQNEEWGFFGTSKSNGYDAELTWNTASRFLIKEFGLTPEEARTVLDARFGRHLADDLSFIKGRPGIASGPTSEKAITAHLQMRIAGKGWRDCFENAIRQETGKVIPSKGVFTKEELFTEIAQRHLGVETLERRMSDSLDFHDIDVSSIRAALEAAFEAGKTAAKKGA